MAVASDEAFSKATQKSGVEVYKLASDRGSSIDNAFVVFYDPIGKIFWVKRTGGYSGLGANYGPITLE